MELTETANELRVRNSDETLCIERALAEERRRDCDLESRSTDAGGMGHERCERAILVAGRDAEHQGRSDLGGKPQVNEPHFTPPGGRHV
jgi:hypothetical protein